MNTTTNYTESDIRTLVVALKISLNICESSNYLYNRKEALQIVVNEFKSNYDIDLEALLQAPHTSMTDLLTDEDFQCYIAAFAHLTIAAVLEREGK